MPAVWECWMSHHGPLRHFPAVSLSFCLCFSDIIFSIYRKKQYALRLLCDMLYLEELKENITAQNEGEIPSVLLLLRPRLPLRMGEMRECWGAACIPSCSFAEVLSQNECFSSQGKAAFEAHLIRNGKS